MTLELMEFSRLRSWRVVLSGIALGLLLVGFQSSAGLTAVAKADYCEAVGGGFRCLWSAPLLPPSTRRYFEAPGGNNNRNWIAAEVADGYGGTVEKKCVNIMAASNGAVQQVACGTGVPSGYVNGAYKPGYMFMVHSAPSARTLAAAASSP